MTANSLTDRYLIIGAGGHGKVIADILLAQGKRPLGFLDDNLAMVGQTIYGLPVLGKIDTWADMDPTGLIVGIGDNTIRRAIVQRIHQQVKSPPWYTAIHPTAIISRSVQIGVGTVIVAGAIINADVHLGNHVIINTAATIDHDCIIQDYVHIAPGAHLAGNVQVADNVLMGVGCSVIPGCKIGANTKIGAGAAVVSDVPPGVVAKGVPARWRNVS
ncbi:acetyltransferase [Phototrophicus methaneseepsis]|uniref:Acetyltransferase n=1 Tax=Phototrophicus methaneseepsis TaxID=2710758 RepID=A0A7S8EAD0_9CHLR|nr:acetyltransferase [Phototrophicus methaneseepsis]QPC83282.1 acetyltransferase [Phototrophicus methaneseepsis]